MTPAHRCCAIVCLVLVVASCNAILGIDALPSRDVGSHPSGGAGSGGTHDGGVDQGAAGVAGVGGIGPTGVAGASGGRCGQRSGQRRAGRGLR